MGPRVPMPQPVSVRGGSDGVEAHYDRIVDMARLFGSVATDTGGAALSMHGYLADPGVFSTAIFDPAGAAEFEAELLDALDGPHGLTSAAARCGLIDIELRAAATAYQLADRLGTTLRDHVGGALQLGPAVAGAVDTLVRTGNVPRSLQTVLTEDPAIVDELMNSGLLTLDGVVAPLYADGRAVLSDRGVDPGSAVPPRSLADVMTALARRCAGAPGEIDVRIMTGHDGTRRAIVDIPGTKTFNPTKTGDITGPATNVRALVGVDTAYERGVLLAMRRAGVRRSDDVMLVGHSEGGMVAVQAALACARTKQFRVSHVVTAGSPVGLAVSRLPAAVRLLALENSGDVVPHLDGRTNPDRVNVTTVTVHRGDGAIGNDHSMAQSYVPGAADVDASRDPSVRSFLSGARGFFAATDVRTHTYVIARRY